MKNPLKPIINEYCRILIAGTFPGEDSIKNGSYYANKRNRFWKIIEEYTSEKDIALRSKSDKEKILLDNKIALYDAIDECEREGSLDSKIKILKLVNMKDFIETHKNINKILCNGNMAYKILVKQNLGLAVVRMPSTSPANAYFKDANLIKKWIIEMKDRPYDT